VTAPAADHLDEALDAARRVARHHGCMGDLVLLHHSNNVVARCGELVFKVSTHLGMAERDAVVAAHAAARGGPALPPAGDLVEEQGFAVSIWPYCDDAPQADEDDQDAAAALVVLHASLVGAPIALPGLAERFVAIADLLGDHGATSALCDQDRDMLDRAVDLVLPEAVGSAVLHAEPHDRNRLRRDGSIVYIDFEAACIGPIEWDLAYLSDAVVLANWPEHDIPLRSILQIGVSTCVSVACWRHFSARPDDAEMRWHADHHLSRVRRRLE
jgi:hypothetical protein